MLIGYAKGQISFNLRKWHDEMKDDFASDYLNILGYKQGWPLNADARLPAVLSCTEIASLMTYGASGRLELPGITSESDWERRAQAELIEDCLAKACQRGLLRSRKPLAEHKGLFGWNYKGFFIHFDDARRYFATLGLVPPDGSMIGAWLRGPADTRHDASIPVQDKADFQQLCAEQWERNPTQTITGERGVVSEVGPSYLNLYKRATLEKWAREVAPAFVKGRRGRPPKSDDIGK